MVGSMKLADEILANASVIPVECQEHILDVIKAMAFTRKVIEKNQTINVKKDEKVFCVMELWWVMYRCLKQFIHHKVSIPIFSCKRRNLLIYKVKNKGSPINFTY